MTNSVDKYRVAKLVEKFVKQNECDRFLFLIESLDELNQMWFLRFIRQFNHENENEWVIWSTEPPEYINLFNELFEILDGHYWYYKMPELNLPDGTRAKWIIHKIDEEN